MSENFYTELRKLSPKVTGGLIRMREETFKDASVPAKYKILAALVAVVVTKCEPCIRGYTKMAFQKGATQDEFIEFLNVAITEGVVSFQLNSDPFFPEIREYFRR